MKVSVEKHPDKELLHLKVDNYCCQGDLHIQKPEDIEPAINAYLKHITNDLKPLLHAKVLVAMKGINTP